MEICGTCGYEHQHRECPACCPGELWGTSSEYEETSSNASSKSSEYDETADCDGAGNQAEEEAVDGAGDEASNQAEEEAVNGAGNEAGDEAGNDIDMEEVLIISDDEVGEPVCDEGGDAGGDEWPCASAFGDQHVCRRVGIGKGQGKGKGTGTSYTTGDPIEAIGMGKGQGKGKDKSTATITVCSAEDVIPAGTRYKMQGQPVFGRCHVQCLLTLPGWAGIVHDMC